MSLFSWFRQKETLGFLATEYHPELQENLYNEAIQKAKDICEEHYKPKPRISAHAQIFASFILKNYKQIRQVYYHKLDDWCERGTWEIAGSRWEMNWYSDRAIKYYKDGAAPDGFREYLDSQGKDSLFTGEESSYIKACCFEAVARQRRDELEYQRQELMKLGEQS